MYIMNNYKDYLLSLNDDTNKKMIEIVDQILKILPMVILVILLIGFSMYFMKQRKDHKENFNVLTFIFGSKKCDSLK